MLLCGVPLRVHRVVALVRSSHRGGKPKHVAGKPEVGGRIVIKERTTLFEDLRVQQPEILLFRMPISWMSLRLGPFGGPVNAPLERPNNAVVCSKAKTVLPFLNPAFVSRPHSLGEL